MANPKYAASDKPVPVAELVATLSDGTKVKRRIPRMRACNEKDEKGKLCAGHLKRWYFFGDEVKQKFGANAEVYRCEHCKTLYLPSSRKSRAPVRCRIEELLKRKTASARPLDVRGPFRCGPPFWAEIRRRLSWKEHFFYSHSWPGPRPFSPATNAR